MLCEDATEQLMDAALGGLHSSREAELRAHVAGCGRCRAEWERARALAAAVDRGVESLVAAEPSLGFESRLRARLAEASAPAAWPMLPWPRFAAAAALVAAVVVIFALAIRTPRHPAAPAESAASVSSATEQRPSAAESATQEQHAPAAREVASRGHAHAPARSGSLPFEVLVPKGQLAAALVLSEGMSGGAIDGAQLLQLSARSAQPLEVKELAIAPLAPPVAPPSAPDDASAPAGGDGRRK